MDLPSAGWLTPGGDHPLGDAESLERLRERTDETVTRPAGSTVLVDGDIPPVSAAEPGQQPEGGTSAP